MWFFLDSSHSRIIKVIKEDHENDMLILGKYIEREVYLLKTRMLEYCFQHFFFYLVFHFIFFTVLMNWNGVHQCFFFVYIFSLKTLPLQKYDKMGVYIEYEKTKDVEWCQDCTEEIAERTYGWLQQN